MLDFSGPVHPMVVHFPIALFICAFGFEILSRIFKKDIFHQTALCLYTTAALVSPLVVRTGLWEAERLHLNHPILEQHETFALWTMWVSLMSLPVFWFLYQKNIKAFRILFIACLAAVLVLVSFTANRGGTMVYEYGVAVQK